MTGRFDLEDRVAVLTGASGRLGQAFARGLAEAGARLVLVARDSTRLAETAATLGDSVVATFPADLREEVEIDRLFKSVREQVGRLDILVNNAGAARDAPFGSVTAADVQALSELNVAAPLLCTQRAVSLMQASSGAKVVNVGSIYGSVAVDTRIYEGSPGMVQGSPAYVASKAALVNLTRELAVRLAPMNIQVNMLSPGGIAADQPSAFQRAYADRTPSGRMATPDDLVGTLLYLCAPASNYVTGQNILIDGGFTAW